MNIFQLIIRNTRELWDWWKPQRQEERILFWGIFAFYFFLTFPLFELSSVINSPELSRVYYGYLRYDNNWYVNFYLDSGYTDGIFLSRHPFLKLILLPMIVFGTMLKAAFGTKAKLFFYLLIFNAVTAKSVQLVFRYLCDVCEITINRAVLLSILFALFFTNIILSFTPESFPISQMLMLTGIVWMSSHLDAKISFSRLLLLSFLNLGITTTNIVKIVIAYWFTNDTVFHRLKSLLLVGVSIASLYGVYFLLCLCLFLPQDKTVKQLINEQYIGYNQIAEPFKYPFFSSEFVGIAFDGFWSPALIAPKIDIGADLSIPELKDILAPQLGAYRWSKRGISVCFLLLFLAGLFLNLRQRHVQILVFAFGFDVFLHLVLLFGYRENHIYAAHWMFLIPLAWGWLYRKTEMTRYAAIFDKCFLFAGIILFVNNIVGYMEFLSFSIRYF